MDRIVDVHRTAAADKLLRVFANRPGLLELAAVAADEPENAAAQQALQDVLVVLDAMVDSSRERDFAIETARLCAEANRNAAAIAQSDDFDFPETVNSSVPELKSVERLEKELRHFLDPDYEVQVRNVWAALNLLQGPSAIFQSPEDAEVRLGLALYALLQKVRGKAGIASELQSAAGELMREVVVRRKEALLRSGFPKEEINGCYRVHFLRAHKTDKDLHGSTLLRPGFVSGAEFSPYRFIAALKDASGIVPGVHREIESTAVALEETQCAFSDQLEFFRSGKDDFRYRGRAEPHPVLDSARRAECLVAAAALETYAETQADKFLLQKRAFQENCLHLAAIIRQELGERLDPQNRVDWVRQQIEALEMPKRILAIPMDRVEAALKERRLWPGDIKWLLQHGTTPISLAKDKTGALRRIAQVAGLDFSLFGKVPSFQVEIMRPLLEPLAEKEFIFPHQRPPSANLSFDGEDQMEPLLSALRTPEICDHAQMLGFQIHVRVQASPDWDVVDEPQNPKLVEFYVATPDGQFYSFMEPERRSGDSWKLDANDCYSQIRTELSKLEEQQLEMGREFSWGKPKPIAFGQRTLL